MTTNLTIELDSHLLHYAQVKGRTVSELVEAQLQRLLQSQSAQSATPVSSKLRGIIKLPQDFDYKKEMEYREL